MGILDHVNQSHIAGRAHEASDPVQVLPVQNIVGRLLPEQVEPDMERLILEAISHIPPTGTKLSRADIEIYTPHYIGKRANVRVASPTNFSERYRTPEK